MYFIIFIKKMSRIKSYIGMFASKMIIIIFTAHRNHCLSFHYQQTLYISYPVQAFPY
jgi:hypothetical protein